MKYRIAGQRALLGACLCLLTAPTAADEPEVNQLVVKDLAGLADKEGMMLTVEYAPGDSNSKHRHNAHTFVYVLEGSIVMQVEGASGNPWARSNFL